MEYDGLRPPPSFGVPGTTKVVTPTGWVQVGDLAPGDHVIDSVGQSCVVRQVASVGAGQTCELGLREGTSLIVGAGQLWRVQVGRGSRQTTQVLTTVEVGEAVTRQAGVRLVPAGAVQLPGIAPLPIAGYALGSLIANGGISAPSAAVLWSVEKEIVQRVAESLPPGSRVTDRPVRQPRAEGWRLIGDGLRNPVLDALRELGLAGRRSYEKFIPRQYLWGPSEDRIALLQGLMDGDGTVDLAGQASYVTSSPALAVDMVQLIQSLSGRCSLQVRRNVTFTAPGQPTARPGRPSYRLGAIRLEGVAPFSLRRKAERVRLPIRTRHWSVRTVRPMGMAPLLAVEIDSTSGGYLVDGFLAVEALPAYAVHQVAAA